ncbi:MAG: hypothetical protein R2722_04175 [Tessaracoccus sp.]
MLKGNVARVVGDSDEEFVFTDDLPEDTEAPEDDVASNDLDRSRRSPRTSRARDPRSRRACDRRGPRRLPPTGSHFDNTDENSRSSRNTDRPWLLRSKSRPGVTLSVFL